MTAQPHKESNERKRWVLTFPAQIPEISGQKVFFLFSTRQVITVLEEMTVWSLPFSPKFSEGIGFWNNDFVPVICLERYLGFNIEETQRRRRMLVVHAPSRNPDTVGRVQGMIRVGRQMQNMLLPEECDPQVSLGWIPDTTVIKGVYGWERRLFIVVDLEEILNGSAAKAA